MNRIKRIGEYNKGRSDYNFKDLVEAYSKSPVYEVIEGKKYQDWEQGGHWVVEEEKGVELDFAAVVPLNRDDLAFDEGGTYNRNDRKMYTYKKLKKGSKVKHLDIYYTVLNSEEYAEYDKGLYIYILRRADIYD